jgi:hypothetical protein
MAGKLRSAVVRRDVFPQPVVALGLAVRGSLVRLVTGDFGKRIAEDLVN